MARALFGQAFTGWLRDSILPVAKLRRNQWLGYFGFPVGLRMLMPEAAVDHRRAVHEACSPLADRARGMPASPAPTAAVEAKTARWP
jgi:hypothetical protein